MKSKHVEEMLRKIREAVGDTCTSLAVDRPSEREIYEALAEESEGWRMRLYEIKEEEGDYDDDEEDDE